MIFQLYTRPQRDTDPLRVRARMRIFSWRGTRTRHQVYTHNPKSQSPARKASIAPTRDQASACAFPAGHGCRSRSAGDGQNPAAKCMQLPVRRKAPQFGACAYGSHEGQATKWERKTGTADRSTAGIRSSKGVVELTLPQYATAIAAVREAIGWAPFQWAWVRYRLRSGSCY